MIETPKVTPFPPQGRAADLLSDLLQRVRLSGSVFFRSEFGAPFGISTGAHAIVARLFGGQTPGNLTAFHMVAEGSCWVDCPGSGRIQLNQGDIVMLPFGDPHDLGNGDAPVVPVSTLVEAQQKEGVMSALRYGGDGETTKIVCGFVQSGALFDNPIFQGLPTVMVERTGAEPVTSMLAMTVRTMLSEVETLRPGSREMLGRMMEVLFVEMLRRAIARVPEDSVGWRGAMGDPIVSRVLQKIHGEPMRDWTVDQLAAAVGSSRSVLSERFKAVLGKPPIQYLAEWRLQLAGNLLSDGSRSIAEIACEVGYESQASFSRAFKRHLGTSPGLWRESRLKTAV
jgi:AraC-like DNA-binding protein